MLKFLKSIAYLTTTLCAFSAQAQDWTALVIGNPGTAAPNAFADSYNVSKAFKFGNVSSVTLHRQISDAAVADAIFDHAVQDRFLFYYSGPLSVENDKTFLSEAPVSSLSVEVILSTVAKRGVTEVIIMIEDCGGAVGQAGMVRIPSNIPQNLSVHFSASSGTGDACDVVPGRMSDLLISSKHLFATTHLQDILAPAWTGVHMEQRVIVTAQVETSPISPVTAGFSPIIDTGSPIVTIVDTPVISPLISVGLSQKAEIKPAAASDVVGDSNIIIFAVPQKEVQASLSLPAGMPEPSIIIGVLRSESASYNTVEDDPSGGATGGSGLSSTEISFDNLDARRAMRAQGEELFIDLVGRGAFDPASNVLVVALQTELKRMGCYRSVVDGDWGGGSKSSVKRYFDEFDGEAVTLDPTIELFRQIILKDDIECVTAKPTAARTTRKTNTGTTARATTKPRAAPVAKAKPKATSKIGAISGIGLGMN